MANRFRGEASVEIDGTAYRLAIDFNAMCAFEDQTGKNALDAFASFETGCMSVSDMRAMMWAVLRKHHPETTLDDAGDLLSENVEALGACMQAAAPEATTEPGKPRRAKAAR